jgi:hypothetical protein
MCEGSHRAGLRIVVTRRLKSKPNFVFTITALQQNPCINLLLPCIQTVRQLVENEVNFVMEYRLHVQRLSSGEHKVNAYPTSGDVLHKTYSSWQDFSSAFSKYMDASESSWLKSELAKASCGIDVFKSRMSVHRAVLDSLGFE